MKKNNVSVVIPNFNGVALLYDCLSALCGQSYKFFEIILVDNGSTDNSIEYTKKNFPKVKILKLNKNFGFAKAINIGVKVSKSKFVVFLNNDTKVLKDWLKNLVNCAINHPEIISVNSKILNYHNHKKIDGVGISVNEVGQARSIGYQEIDRGQYEKEEYIFGATAGASLFKREEYIKLGYFDEDFFMYFEEVDFAFRSQFLGYKSIYCPKAVVLHKHKATSKKFPQHIEYWQFRNMYQTIIKNFPASILFNHFRWLKILLVFLNTFFYQIKNGFYWPPFLTVIFLLFNIIKLLKKRKKTFNGRLVSDEYIESFLRKKKITFWSLLR